MDVLTGGGVIGRITSTSPRILVEQLTGYPALNLQLEEAKEPLEDMLLTALG